MSLFENKKCDMMTVVNLAMVERNYGLNLMNRFMSLRISKDVLSLCLKFVG